MTLTYVLMQNLKRNPLRASLTAVAFALPMAIFVAAISLVAMLVRINQANQQQLRLGVHHRTSLTNTLPEAMRRRIEGLDPKKERITAVCGMRWFGGRVPDAQNTLTSLAADPDTFPRVYTELAMTPEEIEAWNRERRAAVVGLGPARDYGWNSGDRVVLKGTIPPYLELEFRIVCVTQSSQRANFFYFRRDYLDESLKEAGADPERCNIFWVKCRSAQALRSLQVDIDEMNANSPDTTKSEDENAFIANFTQAAGDIPGLMRAMAVVVLVIIALVAGNTMMMSFRERTRELAVFKAIGFQARRVFAIIVAESMMLALLGSAMGILPVAALLYWYPIRVMRFGPISTVELSPFAVVMAFGMALLVGLIAGLWPGIQAMSLRPADALRRVA